jgi:YHS domain-containing protein
MSTYDNSQNAGKIGETACGGNIVITPETHYVIYKGEVVYVCNRGCKEDFESDPLNSCLAARILSEE